MIEINRTVDRLGYRQYSTGIWSYDHFFGPHPPFLGRGWAIGLRWYRHDGPNLGEAQESLADQLGFWPVSANQRSYDDGAVSWISAAELIIQAPNRDVAQRAANLLFSAILLIDAQSLVLENIIALPEDQYAISALHAQQKFRDYEHICQGNLTISAALAAKISHKKHWQYAALKHWMSHRICSVPWIELDPCHAQHHGIEADRANHVIMSQAIIAAYSIVEELGLEIRASAKQPSTIDGKWNPRVLEELEQRLLQGRINLSDHMVWLMRGPPRRLDRGNASIAGPKATWSRGFVRDVLLPVPDAIRRASWLRSRVSSHKLSTRAASLTICDAVNVQMLGRRLLLDTTGFTR